MNGASPDRGAAPALSAREAAAYCGVSERTVRNWITDGKLGAVGKAAGVYQICPADLDTFKRHRPRPVRASLASPPLRMAVDAPDSASELACLRQAIDLLEPLAASARGRVVRYLADLYDGVIR